MEKKKVLFLIHTLGGGGAEKVLVDLVNNLDYSKFDITLMTLIDVGELKYSLNENVKYKTTIKLRKRKSTKSNMSGSLLGKGSKLKNITAKMYANIWKIMPTKLFYKIFIREKYDVEISFLEGICAKVISSSNNKNSKKYAWIHVDLINQRKSEGIFINRKSERKTYEKFNKIVCVSKVVKEQFIKKFNFDADKVTVLYNAINKEDITKKSNELCDDYPFNNDKFTICSVGRLNHQKAYDRLLRISKRLLAENYNINVFIIGEGTSKENLMKYITDNNLSDNIKLLGFKSNPYKYIKNADLFVCSSIAEGFSTAVSEAIILDLPIVTTDCSGMKEMLGENNEYGIVTENNEEDLYIGIEQIIEDKNKYNYYKKKIKERKVIFNLVNIVNKVELLLED